MKLNKCIGIISYFPDEPELRENRRSRCFKLLNQLNTYFRLPIILISQNWNKDDVSELLKFKNQEIYNYSYDKLGIAPARITLRKKFIDSDFDYLIMLDDDMVIQEDQELCNKWLEQIANKEFYYTDTFCTNFCAISKKGIKKVEYENLNPSNGEGFEDWVFAEKCKKVLTSEPFKIFLSSHTRKEYLNDDYSTWDPKDHDLWIKNTNISREKISKINQYILTIVIPVYNSEEYILRTLNSLPLRKDTEIIIIDDCSTDSSLDICKTWALGKSNCMLLHNNINRGVGYSKNIAYTIAKGKYISTVDSDDWCNTSDYNTAINALYKIDYDRITFAAEFNDGRISDGTIRTATWGQFIKKDFLVKNNLNFDQNHRRAEDWFLKEKYDKIPHMKAKLEGIVPYHYNNNRVGSLSWQFNNGEVDDYGNKIDSNNSCL